MSDSKEDMSEEDMETEEALKRMAERDPAVREALIQLTDEDPEKRKEAFAKLGEALGEDFRMRPWRHMSALEMDPEVREFLKTPKVPIYTTFEWHLSYFYTFLIVGFTVNVVTHWGAFDLKWWIIILSTIGAFEIYKIVLKGKIKAMEADSSHSESKRGSRKSYKFKEKFEEMTLGLIFISLGILFAVCVYLLSR